LGEWRPIDLRDEETDDAPAAAGASPKEPLVALASCLDHGHEIETSEQLNRGLPLICSTCSAGN
jgi:hypothetical protein